MMDKYRTNGFTIVELLVVIVIIGILATITIVSYTGITSRAAIATLKSDLKNASTQLGMDNVNNGEYPEYEEDANDGNGLPKSEGTEYQFTSDGEEYCLSATSTSAGANGFHISSDSGAVEDGLCSGHEFPIIWKQIAAGISHTCAIDSNNLAFCWGYNNYGQLGDGSTNDSSEPVAVDTTGELSGKTFKSITAGYYHTCAIASDDLAYCWGYNWPNGQLGIGAIDGWGPHTTPLAVITTGDLSGKTIKSISAGENHACAIASDDFVYCWGNIGGAAPTAVDLDEMTVKSISSGGDNTCAVASDDLAYCWAVIDTSGILSGKTIKSTARGIHHTCVIASDDLAYCWGWNNDGQLGNGLTNDSSVPVAVDTTGALSGKTIKSIGVGDRHTCALASDNLVYCWGYNSDGQLVNGSSDYNPHPFPIAINMDGALNGKTIKSISVNGNQTCVISSDDKYYRWGGFIGAT